MLPVFAMCCAGGAAGGLLCGVVKHLCFPNSNAESDAAQSGGGSSSSSSSVADTPKSGRRKTRPKLVPENEVVVGALCACACAAALVIVRQQQRSKPGKSSRRLRTDGRIPLQDLIRFKERQWFVEELENARDADPNAMLRLAKMYLHGQGCQRNIAMAQEWVRKARNMGVPASLDELFATDDPDPRGKLRALMAHEERRRALRRMGSAGSSAPAYQQGQYTAAA